MADIQSLEIPKWGLSMEEGTIVQWLIQEGECFKKGQELCEIETTKIVNVLEAPFDGTLQKILAEVGDTLAVGKPIALCSDEALSAEEVAAFLQDNNSSATATQEQPVISAQAQVTEPVTAATQQATPETVPQASKHRRIALLLVRLHYKAMMRIMLV